MEKLRIESVDVRVSNAGSNGRSYGIAATAHIESGKVAYVHYGEVNTLPREEGEATTQLATFDTWNGGLNVQFQCSEDKGGIISCVDEFVSLMHSEGAIIESMI